MAEDEKQPQADTEPGLSAERCPNCGGPLRFPPDLSEAFCPACSIFVEIVPSTPPASVQAPPVETDNRKRLAVARFYVDMEDVLEEVPAPADGQEPPAASGAVAEAVNEPATDSETSSASEPVEVPSEALPEMAEPAPAPERPPSDGSREEAPSPPGETPPVPEGTAEGPEEVEEGEVPPAPAETQEGVEEVTGEPVEGPPPPPPDPPLIAVVQAGATTLVFERPVAPLPIPPPPDLEPELLRDATEAQPRHASAQAARAESRSAKMGARLGHRVAFYAGAIEVAIGGAGLVFGSVLHDWFRVPVIGHAFNAFGPLNMAAVLIGGVLTLMGLTAMAFGTQAGKRKGRTVRG